MPDDRRLEDRLPGLEDASYQVTSRQTTDYNCIAWVFGDTEHWWSPVAQLGSYWPPEIPRSLDVGTFIALFELHGFDVCESEELESNYEKIAIFAVDGYFTHVARQLLDGRWTSKLGNDVDIEHELHDLTRRESPYPQYRYGAVAALLRRPRPA